MSYNSKLLNFPSQPSIGKTSNDALKKASLFPAKIPHYWITPKNSPENLKIRFNRNEIDNYLRDDCAKFAFHSNFPSTRHGRWENWTGSTTLESIIIGKDQRSGCVGCPFSLSRQKGKDRINSFDNFSDGNVNESTGRWRFKGVLGSGDGIFKFSSRLGKLELWEIFTGYVNC